MNSINRSPLKEIVHLIKSTDTNAEDDQSNRQGMSFSTSEENVKPSKLMLRKRYKRKMGEFDSHTHRKMEDTNVHINPNDDLNSSNAGTTDHPDDTAKRTVNTTPYQCEKCNVYFPDRTKLNRHMNKKNLVSKSVYSSMHVLNAHIKQMNSRITKVIL